MMIVGVCLCVRILLSLMMVLFIVRFFGLVFGCFGADDEFC